MNTIQNPKNGSFSQEFKNILNYKIFPYVFFLIIIFIIYAKSVMFGITELDDKTLVISQYGYLQDPYNIISAFFKSIFNDSADTFYRPFLTVSWIIDTVIGGGRLWVYHFFDIVYHFIAVCLLFNLLKNLKIPHFKAFLFAAFFAVLPVFNQAVSWIPGRNDTLLAVFIFSSFMFFVKYSDSNSLKHIFLSSFFFLCALFTKETAFAALLVFPFYLVLNKRNDLKKKLILSILLFFACSLLWYFMKNAFTAAKDLDIMYLAVYTKAALIKLFPATLQYISKIFLPVNLKVMPVLSLFDSLLGIFVVGVITSLLIKSKNVNRSNILFGSLWFAAFLVLPYFQNNYFMLEHRAYAAVLGLIIILNEIKPGKNVKTVLPYLLAIYFIFFVCVSIININKFANKLNFATAAMLETPFNMKTTFLYGRRSLDNNTVRFGEYFMKKNYEDVSIRAKQKNIPSSAFLGLFAWQRGDMKAAKKYLTIAVDKNTDVHEAYAVLADIYVKEGRYEEALINMKKAFKVKPENPEYFRFLKLIFEKINSNKQH
ncbi:MAG: tetratricopeptide repeat protein [Endomicrobia bacterium]|nr:tetratricopeptide repeat protein [Endomicrobiia bacterium]